MGMRKVREVKGCRELMRMKAEGKVSMPDPDQGGLEERPSERKRDVKQITRNCGVGEGDETGLISRGRLFSGNVYVRKDRESSGVRVEGIPGGWVARVC